MAHHELDAVKLALIDAFIEKAKLAGTSATAAHDDWDNTFEAAWDVVTDAVTEAWDGFTDVVSFHPADNSNALASLKSGDFNKLGNKPPSLAELIEFRSKLLNK